MTTEDSTPKVEHEDYHDYVESFPHGFLQDVYKLGAPNIKLIDNSPVNSSVYLPIIEFFQGEDAVAMKSKSRSEICP